MEQMQELVFWIILGTMIVALFLLFGKELLFNLLAKNVQVTP